MLIGGDDYKGSLGVGTSVSVLTFNQERGQAHLPDPELNSVDLET